MPLVRFEPTISAGERSQTYDLDRVTTETGAQNTYWAKFQYVFTVLFYRFYNWDQLSSFSPL
jgi:hypothetical protein